jgi:hypothetical protein
VVCHNPKLLANASITNWSMARLSSLAPDGLKQRIPWRCQTNSKHNLDRWVEQVLLQRVDNPMFHGSPANAPLTFWSSARPSVFSSHHAHAPDHAYSILQKVRCFHSRAFFTKFHSRGR